MTPVTCFAGKNVALFGLGGSGLVSARALLAGGAKVSAWDDGETGRAKAAAAGIDVVDLREADFAGFDALVLSPGVPLTHPAPHWAAAKAKAAGVEIIGDIELFCRERAAIAPGSPFVAITGTNGKSTTTALLAHILASVGRDVAMGGNIGVAILDLPPPAMDRIHVIECSSFQIDLAPSLNPSIGILTNITPDHLDRHGSMENYATIKARLVLNSQVALVSVDDPFSAAIAKQAESQAERPQDGQSVFNPAIHAGGRAAFPVSIRQKLQHGIFASGGEIIASLRHFGTAVPLGTFVDIPTLRGLHNIQNAAFALAAAYFIGEARETVQHGLNSFPGLKHRMEQVRRIGRVLFVNDSKATNADSTEKAMLSFDDMFIILGGKPKQGGIEALRPLFPKIRKAYLIGTAAAEFAATLGPVPHEISGTLDIATAHAARDAAACDAREPVVLLSPACASYDQFANFEVRGDHFRALVQALVAGKAAA